MIDFKAVPVSDFNASCASANIVEDQLCCFVNDLAIEIVTMDELNYFVVLHVLDGSFDRNQSLLTKDTQFKAIYCDSAKIALEIVSDIMRRRYTDDVESASSYIESKYPDMN